MKHLRLVWSLVFCLSIVFGFAQTEKQYSQDLFISPVQHPIILSGSFAEPRTNHFHAGIDIRPSASGAIDSIVSVADGVIKRIMVHPSGYGNSILIDHQNGYSSLYAHLDKFSEKIATKVRKKQLERKTFQITLMTNDLNIRVKQGEAIGVLGNTGRSFGAHLHFEIRNAANDHPLNPMLFGLKPNDTKAPELFSIKGYALSNKNEVLSITNEEILKSEDQYSLSNDTLYVPTDRFQLSVEMLDKMNGAPNKNGVYKLEVFENGALRYAYKMDELDFEVGHHINAHIDFFEKSKNKKNFSYCHHDPIDQLPIYPFASKIPYFEVKDSSKINIKIKASDFHGNSSELEFLILKSPDKNNFAPVQKVFNYGILANSAQIIEKDDYIIHFPKNSLKQDEKFMIQNYTDSLGNNVLKIENEHVPLFQGVDILLKKTGRDSLSSKHKIARASKEEWTNLGGVVRDSFMKITTYSLGTFTLIKDTIPPTIEALSFQEDLTGKKSFSFEIKDNLEPSGSATYLDYQGFIDGKWILLEYDLKKDKITHRFDPKLKGKHTLKLLISDIAGNTMTYESPFFR